jgi:hypothetical protein
LRLQGTNKFCNSLGGCCWWQLQCDTTCQLQHEWFVVLGFTVDHGWHEGWLRVAYSIPLTNRPSPGVERRFGHLLTHAELSHAQSARRKPPESLSPLCFFRGVSLVFRHRWSPRLENRQLDGSAVQQEDVMGRTDTSIISKTAFAVVGQTNRFECLWSHFECKATSRKQMRSVAIGVKLE